MKSANKLNSITRHKMDISERQLLGKAVAELDAMKEGDDE